MAGSAMDKPAIADFHFRSTKSDNFTKTSVRVKSVHKSLQDTSKSSDKTSSSSVSSRKTARKTVVHGPTKETENDNPFNFAVGSAVKHFEKYGVVKWIGTLPGDKKLYAKIELENSDTSGRDGVYRGVKYKQNKEMFTFLGQLKPDKRIKKGASPITGRFSQISNQSDDSHKNTVFAAACNSQTSPCNLKENTSQANGQLHDIDSSHKEGIITDDDVKLVGISSHSTERKDINPHNLMVGSVIEYDEPVQYGVIKWIGKLPDQQAIFAGVEMDDDISCEESDDGEWAGIEYYQCRPGRGMFVQLSALKPGRRPVAVVLQNPHNFKIGTTVRHREPAAFGVIKWMGILPDDQKMAYAGLEMDEEIEEGASDGVWEGERYYHCEPNRGRFVPLIELKPCNEGNRKGSADNILLKCANESNATECHPSLLRQSSLESLRCADNPNDLNKSQHISSKLEMGSLVQFGSPVQYGVIKRIEIAVDTSEETAEVETEYNQLKKIPLTELQPDNRFIIDVNKIEGNINPLEKEHYKHDEEASHVPPDKKFSKHKHTSTKGIQGYKNSCYLDATLYGMFTFSDAFDVLLMEKVTTNVEELRLQNILKSKIVYPLRKKGIVVQEPVEEFRELLAKLQDMKGLTSEEKDPEEFLNLLFKHVLHIEPFITIRRPSGIDEEYFVQLFVEPDQDKSAVNTQTLLCKMFQEQNISFTKSPTQLLLQMPRYGKSFKSFQRIIPSLKLNITSLCMTTGLCSVCKNPAGYVCNDCSRHHKHEMQFYCSTCSPQWHQNSCDHKHELDSNNSDTGALQLLSVLCIETSHYVCFTRITGSSGKDEWVFFDSMAERQDNGYNLPKVTHCTDQMHKFVYGKKDIGKIPSKNLPELVRRFVEDAYLCIYIARHTEQHSAGIKR